MWLMFQTFYIPLFPCTLKLLLLKAVINNGQLLRLQKHHGKLSAVEKLQSRLNNLFSQVSRYFQTVKHYSFHASFADLYLNL